MSESRQSLRSRFISRPPELEGGLRCAIEPLGDGAVRLVVGDGAKPYRARAAVLSVPYPSGLRRLLAAHEGIDAVLVEVASPGLDRAAGEMGVGYLDMHGRGRLMGPGFVYVVPPHARGAAGDDGDSQVVPVVTGAVSGNVAPFAPKASRVARLLLDDPHRRWRLADLAKAARMNPGNVHRLLAELEERGYLERDGMHHRVLDPGALLDAWASQAKRPRAADQIQLRVGPDLDAAVRAALDRCEGSGVVSGELAAERYAPHLPASGALVHCFSRADLDRIANGHAGPLRADGVLVVRLSDEGVADGSQERGGLPLVSPAQLYVDLFPSRGRGREAAEHVRREILRV